MTIENIAVLGGSMGDESKSRCVHYFAPKYDFVIRMSGGDNCGHTLYRNGKKYVHHLVPSVDWRQQKTRAFLGAGMVINPNKLYSEIKLFEQDFIGIGSRIIVDPEAFIVTEEHIKEDILKNDHLGSTKRGIGPAYSSKVARTSKKIAHLIKEKSQIITDLKNLGVQFLTTLDLYNTFKKSSLIFEGAQSILLDITHGIYPYVSSGNATITGIYESGFYFAPPTIVYGVIKPYVTRVASGPFPSEFDTKTSELYRELGQEYGATTGRSRRCGAIDLPALRYAIKKGGINALIISKLDIIYGHPSIKICTYYEKEPTCSIDFETAKPNYIEMPGWKSDKDINMMNFVKFIEQEVDCKIHYLSVGVNDENIIKL